MIEIKNISVTNFEGAIRGMRNPLNSWNQSDSIFTKDIEQIGEKDLLLAQKLIKAGTDHSKFMRQIFVSMDITAPLYWWKEMDTYKVGTVANSTSTMHKLASTPITKDLFSFDKELDNLVISNNTEKGLVLSDATDTLIKILEALRQRYLKTNYSGYWRALVQLLPEAWDQTRTWTANYQVLRNIYFARRIHKLTEWHTFCDEIAKLPYAEELIMLEGKGK